MDTWVWIALAVIVAVLIVVIVAAVAARNRRRRHLADRFGPEYDATIEGAGSRRRAERELSEREAERERIDLRRFTDAERSRYRAEWEQLQKRFVDRPESAVVDADALIAQVMRDAGYPVDDFDHQAALISVDHPTIVENYRRAHGVYERSIAGQASTEDQREAVISYRALFDELLGSDQRIG